MKTLQTRSRTNPQGVLSIAMPIGLPSADVDVVLVVSESTQTRPANAPANGAPEGVAGPMDAAAWNQFVDETAGAWEGEFVRPPQGEFEEREPFA